MARPKKQKEEEFDIFEALEQGLVNIQATGEDVVTTLGIVDFIVDMVDAYDLDPLFGNRTVLKAFFNEPFDDREKQIMDQWVKEGKTNWKPPEDVVAEENLKRIAEGKPQLFDPSDPDAIKQYVREHFAWRELILEAGMRGGKSIGANSLIATTSGLLKFGELLPQVISDHDEIHPLPAGIKFQTLNGPKTPLSGISEIKQKTIKVKTRFGFEIEGSLVHPMLVMDTHGNLVWKKLPDVQPGDYFVVERARKKPGLFGRDDLTGINPEIGRMLGYLVGDGWVKDPVEVRLTSADDFILDDFMSILRNQFGVTPGKRLDKRTKDTYDLYFNSKPTREKLELFGLDHVDAFGKSVPKAVRMASRDTVREFLRGLFDTDGSAMWDGKKVGIELGSVSHELLRQVQALLLQFGIVASLKYKPGKYVKKDGSTAFSYRLCLHGAEAIRFFKHIGFGLGRKQAVYLEARANHNTTVDKIPHLHEKLKTMKALEGSTSRGSGRNERWNEIRRQCTNTTRRTTGVPGGISYDLLDKVIDYFEPVKGCEKTVQYLKTLRDSDLFFDPVVEISEGFDYLYDAEVPEGHHFIANGLVTHNTQMGAFIVLYVAWKLMSIPRANWRKVFNLNIPSGVPMYMTCLAASADSTERTIYGQVCAYMRDSNFFKKLIEQQRLVITDKDISFPEANFAIVAGNSKASGQVGRAAFVVVFDEIAFHINDQGKSNAKDLYDRLGRSTTNLGNAGKIIAISSVKEEGDYMQELQRESWDKQFLGCLCFSLATWELNEALSPEAPVIAKAYATDPVAAARDYENIRPAAEDAFLNPALIDMAVSHEWDKNVLFHRHNAEFEREDETGKIDKRTYTQLVIDKIEQISPGWYSVGHGDAGIVKDSFAVATGHPEAAPHGIVTVIDLVLDWVPGRTAKGDPIKVDFLNVEEVILKLWKARNLIRFSFDHWQGESHIQRLWREGLQAREENFNGPRQFDGYMMFRQRLNEGLIKIPNYPTLLEELKSLILKNGKRIDHPKRLSLINRKPLSKDLADCIMIVDNYIANYGAAFARTPYQNTATQAPQSVFRTVGNSRASQINWDFGR